MCGSQQNEARVMATVIARRKAFAYNRRDFVFLTMFNIVSDLVDSGVRHFFAGFVFLRRHRLSLGNHVKIPEQMDGNIKFNC